MKRTVFTAAALGCALWCGAADLYVDCLYGADKNPGTKEKPMRSIPFAAKKARPGDTVYILPAGKPILQNILLRDVVGEPDKPVTIDGMFNIFVGVRPLKPADWTLVSPGLYKRTRQDAGNWTSRYFMVVNGKQQHMGRYTKAKGAAAFKKPETLKPGEWTIVDTAPKQKGRHAYDYYIRLDEKAPASEIANWAEPFPCSGGVQVSKKNANLTIRNIIAKHFWNDGFNIHGDNRNIVFDTIAAVECGDDGISAHEAATITVRNFVAIGNSTGACHIQQVQALHENLYIEKTLGSDLFFTSDTRNILKDTFVSGNSVGGFKVTNKTGSFEAQNLVFVNRNPQAKFTVEKNKATVTFTNCSFSGFAKAPKFKGITTPAELPEAALAAQRKALFARFNGQLEKAIAE